MKTFLENNDTRMRGLRVELKSEAFILSDQFHIEVGTELSMSSSIVKQCWVDVITNGKKLEGR